MLSDFNVVLFDMLRPLNNRSRKKFCVGRIRDVFLLNRRIANGPGEFFWGNEWILKRRADCFGDKRFPFFFANSITPVYKRSARKNRLSLKERFAAVFRRERFYGNDFEVRDGE
jgi:hypothetical protein